MERIEANTIESIVVGAQAKMAEMGGGSQPIGKLFELAGSCGAEGEDAVLEFMGDLGEALDNVGLRLTSGPGRPQDLYVEKSRD